MDRRKFIGSLGAGVVTLGLAGCGLKIADNSPETKINGSGKVDTPAVSNSQIPGSPANGLDQSATNAAESPRSEANGSEIPNQAAVQQPTAEAPVSQPVNEETPPPAPLANTILVAYFSRTGNTRRVANQIQARVGGNLFEIRTVNPYPDDLETCLEQAMREKDSNFRPQLKARVENIAAYNVVFLGYPIWHHTMPMALFTFLENHDLAQKTIIPFCTYDGSGIGGVAQIRQMCQRSTVLTALGIQKSNLGTAQNEISAWLRGMGYIK